MAAIRGQGDRPFLEKAYGLILHRDPETAYAYGISKLYGVPEDVLTDVSDEHNLGTRQLYLGLKAEADRRLTVEVQPGMAAQHEVEAGPLTAGGRRTPGAAILADMEDRGFELEPADEPLGDAVGVGIHRRCYLKTRGSLQVLPMARQKRTNKKWIAYLPG